MYSAQIDRAYEKACREGTKKVFNARLILVGYAKAGKTSLAHRLLGEDFDEHEPRTEGIALHRIESVFNRKKEETEAGKWGKKELNIMDLLSEFKYGVFEEIKKQGRESSAEEHELGYVQIHAMKYSQKQSHDPGYIPKRATDKIQKIPQPVEESSLDGEHFQTIHISPPTEQDRKEIMDVIPRQESAEETPFSISLWDLGGQDEFIATHHLFLNTEATIVIVMDITKGMNQLVGGKFVLGDINSVVESLDYWLNLFHTDASKHNRTPDIAIVLTHIDQIEGNQDEYIKNYTDNIMERIKTKPYAKYINTNSIYAVNNTVADNSVFQDLRNKLLKHLSNQNTWGMDMPLTWFKLKAEIIQEAEQKTQKHLYLHEVWKLGKKIGMGTDAVESFLKRQTVLGDLVYFPDLRDLVISDPHWLVDKCKSLITTRKCIEKRMDLSKNLKEALNKGQVTENDLERLWNNDGVVFLIKLMEKFDLLADVSNEFSRKYIIPCMLPSSVMQIKQKGVPLKLLTDTFPQLVSKCSKLKNWKLSLDNLSYTTATFHIGEDVRLDTWLSSFRVAQTRIWCSDYSDHINTRSEIRRTMSRLLEPCDTETTYGNVHYS